MKNKLTKDEISLLLYFEARAVDYSGIVVSARMNDVDLEIASRWNKSGFISFGRVCFEDATAFKGANWVRLSMGAYKAAAKERMERAERLWEKRGYRTTEDKRRTTEVPR